MYQPKNHASFGISWYFREDEKTKLKHEALNMFTKDFGILQGKERFYSIICDRSILRPTLFNADGFFEIVDLVNSLGEKVSSICTNPKQMSILTRKDLNDLARLNHYFVEFHSNEENDGNSLNNNHKELTKIHLSKKLNPVKFVEAFYRLVSISVPTQNKSSIEFPESLLGPTNFYKKRSIHNSLLGFLLSAFIREGESTSREIIDKIFEALNSRLDSALDELDSLSISSIEGEITSTLTAFSHWIDLIKVLINCLGERTGNWESESSYQGLSDFVSNKNLVKKLPKIISTLEEKFRTLSSILPKDSEQKRVYLILRH